MKSIKSLFFFFVYLFLINATVLGSETTDFSEDDIESVSVSVTSSASESSSDMREVIHRVQQIQQAQANLILVPDSASSDDCCSNLLMVFIPMDISLISFILIMVKLDGPMLSYMMGLWFGLTVTIFTIIFMHYSNIRI